MTHWTAPKGSAFCFSLGFVDGGPSPDDLRMGGLSGQMRERLSRDLRVRFGLSPKAGFQADKLNLTDPRLPDLLEAVDESRKQLHLMFRAAWVQEPLARATNQAWYQIDAGPGEFRSPARTVAGTHVGWRDFQQVMSRPLRQVIELHGLSGLDWLPLEDSSPSDPMEWFEVFATHPIGRGLDHPMFDSTRYLAQRLPKDRIDPARRIGIPSAEKAYIRPDVEVQPGIVTRMIQLDLEHFGIRGHERFVREYLPPTDFAYSHWGFRPDTGPGCKGRVVRSICCNARTRKILIESGLMRASRFTTLATVDAADAQSEILDRTVPFPLPPPIYTPQEAIEERLRREAVRRDVAPPVRKPVFGTIDIAIATLTSRLAGGTATWTPARDAPEFQEIIAAKLLKNCPEAWRAVLPLLPMEVYGADKIQCVCLCSPAWNDWLRDERGGDPAEAPSRKDLVIANDGGGDWYSIRAGDPLLPGDAQVTHWDHETTTISDQWPNIAAFVSYLIGLCDEAAQENKD